MMFMNSNLLPPAKHRTHDHIERKAPKLRTHFKTLERSSWRLSIILLAAFAVSLPLQAVTRYRESYLLVKWTDGPESYAAALGNSAIGSTVKRNFNAIGWQLVELTPGMSVSGGLEAYQQLGTVLAAEPDGIFE